MSDVLFAWLDERSLAWQYLGIATQMIIDLGMHSEHKIPQSADLDQLQWLESRRRTFWAAFGKFSTHRPSLRSRPPALTDRTMASTRQSAVYLSRPASAAPRLRLQRPHLVSGRF